MENYTNKHKYLLQIITRKRMFERDDLKAIYNKIFQDRGTLDDAIKLINSKINQLNLTIEKITCEVSEKTVYILFQTIKPKVNIIDLNLSLSQKEFMSLVFQGIITNNGELNLNTAINLGNKIKNKGLQLVDCEKVVNDLIKLNFLMYTNDKESNICFTPLAILELEPEFKESFGDYINDCPLCKRIIFFGKTCINCSNKYHNHCLQNFSLKRKTVSCPECKSTLD